MTQATSDSASTRREKRSIQRDRLTFLLLGAVTVSVTVIAATLLRAGAAIAGTTGLLVALGALGWALWRSAPDHRDGYQTLGTGLLVSVVVAGAVGSAQLAIDHRRSALDDRRERAAAHDAEKQSLRVALGLRERLVGIDLKGKDLERFYLAGKRLAGAQLEGTRMSRVVLDGSTLNDANLRSAVLDHASLFKADLRNADLHAANLTGAVLSAAALEGATLTEATLVGAELSADLSDLDLRGADLRRAVLVGATLSRAQLAGVNLAGTDLRNARLGDASLRTAVLRRADLRGADLRRADLTAAEFTGARVDARTRWPDCVDPPPGPVVPSGWTPTCL